MGDDPVTGDIVPGGIEAQTVRLTFIHSFIHPLLLYLPSLIPPYTSSSSYTSSHPNIPFPKASRNPQHKSLPPRRKLLPGQNRPQKNIPHENVRFPQSG